VSSVAIHCIRCEGIATTHEELYDCERCDHVMPIDHGVLWTAPGDPPPLSESARLAITRGWYAAAGERFGAEKLTVREFMTATNGVRTERLGDWQFLIEPPPDGVALILNDPWGAHMTAISRAVGEVAVFQQEAEIAQYLRVRAEQERLTKVSVIASGRGALDFPFTREQFDVIALVGPWVRSKADADHGEPLEVLSRAAFRMLRKGGSFVIGLTNRFGLPVRVPMIPGAKRLSWVAASLPLFRARLSRAGFHDLQFYLPVPHFTDYVGLVSLDSRPALRYFQLTYRHPRAHWKRFLMGAAIGSGIVPMVAPSYIATARKP
jgi:SAM-dependent methyltransferase